MSRLVHVTTTQTMQEVPHAVRNSWSVIDKLILLGWCDTNTASRFHQEQEHWSLLLSLCHCLWLPHVSGYSFTVVNLTIQLFSPGLVITGHQCLGFVVIAVLFWCQATFLTALSSFLPYHSVFCRIPGRLVGLVLSLVFLQGMTCISCCTAPFPPSVNHLRCGSCWSIPPQHGL